MIPASLRLPITADARRLRQDLDRIVESDFLPHFNRSYYTGDWSVVPLRSIGGRADHIYPDPTKTTEFADTPLLERCGYVREILAGLHFPLQAVRFLRLRPGSVVRTHRDLRLGFEDGEVRLHLPIATHPEVEFVLDGRRVVMGEGECWYHNFNLPHSVANRGTTDRIHLVMDGTVNPWLADLLTRTAEGAASPL